MKSLEHSRRIQAQDCVRRKSGLGVIWTVFKCVCLCVCVCVCVCVCKREVWAECVDLVVALCGAGEWRQGDTGFRMRGANRAVKMGIE